MGSQLSADALSNALARPELSSAQRRARMSPDDRVVDAMKSALDRLTSDGVMPPKEEKYVDERGEWLPGGE